MLDFLTYSNSGRVGSLFLNNRLRFVLVCMHFSISNIKKRKKAGLFIVEALMLSHLVTENLTAFQLLLSNADRCGLTCSCSWSFLDAFV